MKVSVIIPCYNMKIYLAECLNSILSQSLKDIEIVCIDDGSNDGTKELLEDFQDKYDNIRITSQSNKGSGSARNKGMELAQGEFVAFMDADDFYPDTDILEYLYETALRQVANICGGSFCSYRNGVYTFNGFRKGMVFNKDGWINSKEFPTFTGYWRFLFRKSFLFENNIVFPDYLRGQDCPFFVNALSKAEKIYCLKKVTYCYRKEHKVVKFDLKKAVDFIQTIKDCLIIAKENGLNRIYEALVDELNGEPTALMYHFAREGSLEMRRLIHDINLLVSDNNDRNTRFLEDAELDKHLEMAMSDRERFFSKIDAYSKILVYGAGTVGRKVLSFLRSYHYEPEAFIVSDLKQNPTNVEGVDVKSIEDYISIRNDCFVIVATFPYLNEEIREVLDRKKFTEYYLLDLEKFYLWCGEIIH